MQTLSPQHESKLADPGRAPDEVALHRDSAAQLPALLDKLPGRQREALRLKFQDGLSYRDIARVMRVSESNVGFLLHTAIKTLGVHMKHLQGALT
jgi:RNA polymerase sigma-70 factor (ECF subfamily)